MDNCYKYMFNRCSSLKFSSTQDSTYQYGLLISDTVELSNPANNPVYSMFFGTGGSFHGTPKLGTTYYTDHPLVS